MSAAWGLRRFGPDGYEEELALERAAIAEHEERAAWLWRGRQYAEARREQAEAEASRAHVRELEQHAGKDEALSGPETDREETP